MGTEKWFPEDAGELDKGKGCGGNFGNALRLCLPLKLVPLKSIACFPCGTHSSPSQSQFQYNHVEDGENIETGPIGAKYRKMSCGSTLCFFLSHPFQNRYIVTASGRDGEKRGNYGRKKQTKNPRKPSGCIYNFEVNYRIWNISVHQIQVEALNH